MLSIMSCLQSTSFNLEKHLEAMKLSQALFGVQGWAVPSVGRLCAGLVSLKCGSQGWLSVVWLGLTS